MSVHVAATRLRGDYSCLLCMTVVAYPYHVSMLHTYTHTVYLTRIMYIAGVLIEGGRHVRGSLQLAAACVSHRRAHSRDARRYLGHHQS